MSNFSYQVLQTRYKELAEENKKLKEVVSSENKFHYYYYANKNQIEKNKELIAENKYNLEMCKKYNHRYILIDDKYEVDFEL